MNTAYDSPEPAADRFSAAGPARPVAAVTHDLPCACCGYNLRTLAFDGTCPECACPVQRAFDRWLWFANLEWLRRLRSGVTGMLILIPASIVWLIAVLAFLLLAESALPDSERLLSPPGEAFVLMNVIAFFAVWLKRVWELSTPEPASHAYASTPRMSRWIRILSVAPIGVVPCTYAGFGGFVTDPVFGVREWTALALECACLAAGAVGLLLLLIHLRRIARRVDRQGLAKLMTFLIWGGVALGVYTLAVWVFVFILVIAPMSSGVAAAAAPSAALTTASTTVPVASPAVSPAAPLLPGPGRLVAYVMIVSAAGGNALSIACMIGGVVVLVWFRRTLTRVMRLHQDALRSGTPAPDGSQPRS